MHSKQNPFLKETTYQKAFFWNMMGSAMNTSWFVSEDMACIKPDPAFFCMMLDELQTTADRCLMTGDSVRSDIVGANAVGMDCIWFNRRAEELPQGVRVKATVSDLRRLPVLL